MTYINLYIILKSLTVIHYNRKSDEYFSGARAQKALGLYGYNILPYFNLVGYKFPYREKRCCKFPCRNPIFIIYPYNNLPTVLSSLVLLSTNNNQSNGIYFFDSIKLIVIIIQIICTHTRADTGGTGVWVPPPPENCPPPEQFRGGQQKSLKMSPPLSDSGGKKIFYCIFL